MHFSSMSRNDQVTTEVVMDKLSSSATSIRDIELVNFPCKPISLSCRSTILVDLSRFSLTQDNFQ